MMTPPAVLSRQIIAAAWRIALAILPLGAGLAIMTALLPATGSLSDPMTLLIRIAAGIALCVRLESVAERARGVAWPSAHATDPRQHPWRGSVL